jgi:hypothetical protein
VNKPGSRFDHGANSPRADRLLAYKQINKALSNTYRQAQGLVSFTVRYQCSSSTLVKRRIPNDTYVSLRGRGLPPVPSNSISYGLGIPDSS